VDNEATWYDITTYTRAREDEATMIKSLRV
jgi:hypothetical protein